MKGFFTNLKSPLLVGFLFALPFILLEWTNRRIFNEDFPVTLFGVLWLLPVIFILVMMSVVRSVRAGKHITARPVSLLFNVALLILIAILWAGVVIDQMPCFLGVPFCD